MNREYYRFLNEKNEEIIEDMLIKIKEDIESALYELNQIKGVEGVNYAKKYLEELCYKL